MMLKNMSCYAVVLLPLLSACQAIQSPQAAANTEAELKKMQQQSQSVAPLQVPAAVQDDLLTPLPPQVPQSMLQPRFNVSALNVEMAEFFASLVLESDYSVMVHPQVTGQLSLQLKQVTLPEVMQVIQQMYGYDIRLTGNVYQVFPAGFLP